MKYRRADILIAGISVGTLSELDDGYEFSYHRHYLQQPHPQPVSLTLPVREETFRSRHIPAFFSGLLAEGSLAEIQCRTLRIDERDIFGRLLETCHDTIGAVTVRAMP
jgi:serine/threonine-protein kinase HipA